MARQLPEPEKRVGILTGWRCWTVLRQEGLLRPIYQRGMIWRPRQPYEAFCALPDTSANTRGRATDLHPVPWASCHCGIWAVCHPMLLQEVSWDWKENETLVVGQVGLWGRVIEFERGWRAQFGYPTHLYALTDDELLAQTLRERYEVPVAAGAAAWALERILPPNLRAPGRADGSAAAPEEMPAVPFALAGIVEMVENTEASQLERLREDLRQAEARLKLSRELLAVERQRLRLERREQLAMLERTAIELTRRREKAQPARARSPQSAPRPELVARAAELKQAMKDRGINQGQVAIAAGVSRTAVCHALAGRRDSRVLEVIEKMVGRQPMMGGDLRAAGVRARLSELGWTQTDLARRLDVTPQRVSQVLRSHRGGNTVLWKRIEQELKKGK